MNDGTTSEDDKLGAIGDIAFVLDQAQVDDDLVIVAGDNLFSEDLADFGRYVRERDEPVLALYDVGDLDQMSKYNAIETDAEGRITFFEEKPAAPTSTLTGIALYFYPRGDAAADPSVHRGGKQSGPAGTPRRMALLARRLLHVARAG